ncbi:hypothetical protein [Pulveribacter sp.]|uniref:hypothetical protein n=1 Tax=Pulveribacter sp. TaxID=2678893 RepID=UPI0028A92224|nr:hypothetical protein [Pulveribacter sp.]
MTDIVPVPAAADVPPFPALGSPAFNAEAYTWGTAMPGVSDRIHDLATATRTNAVATNERAVSAQEAKADAQDARDAAQTARGGAEAASGTSTTQAGIATSAAGTATTQAGIATSAAGTATTQAGIASTARVDAETARDLTEQYRDAAEVFATQQLKATSSTSLTPGAGLKTFTAQPSRSFVPGMYLVATSSGALDHKMAGVVQSYDASTGVLVIGVDDYAGAGAKADWVIGVAAPGASGAAVARITANTTASAGVYYVALTPGITLTIPSGFAAKGFVGGRNASGGDCFINWTTNTLAGDTPEAPMRWPALGKFEATFDGSTFA